MSENKATKITKKIEISKIRLWLIWCLLFLFPAITAIFGFNYFKQEYLYFNTTDLIYKGFYNIKRYNELIAPEAFIEDQLSEIKKIDTTKPIEIIKKQIDSEICGNTLFCIFIDEKNKDTKIINSTKSNNISTGYLKTCLINLAQAYNEEKNKSSEHELYKIEKQLGYTLQTIFKTITPVTIFKDKISKNYSVVYNGELYFIFAYFDKPSNFSSFFAVLQGGNFSAKKMLKKLSNKFPEIEIVLREVDTVKTSKNPELFHSGLKSFKDNIYIIAPTSLIFTRHFNHNGTTTLNTNQDNLFPFIKYKVPTKTISNDIYNIQKILHFSVILILIISSAYFLNISLFRFGFNMKFKTKIIILTFITALFPFTVFSIGIFSMEKFNRFMKEIQIQHQAVIELKNFSQDLEHYINKLENQLIEFATSLSADLANPTLKPSELLSKFTDIGEKLPISKQILYLDFDSDSDSDSDSFPADLKIIFDNNKFIKSYPNRISKDLIEAKNEKFLDNIPLKVLKVAKEKEPNNKEIQNAINIGGIMIESQDYGDSFRNNGKLIPFNQLTTTSWFHVQQIKKYSNSKKTIGILLTEFEPKPILYFYFKESKLAEKDFRKTKYNNYEIQYAFLPIDKSGSAKIWNGSGISNISAEDKNLCLKYPQSNQIVLPNKKIIIKRNQKIPHLAVAIITELVPLNERNYIIKIILSVIVYLSLILYFSSKLIDIMFIEPVMLLASSALVIAKGGEKWNTEIKSGDEFEDLNNNFKSLVTGLKERNILKSYVSEDAFSEIEGASETNLKPGGEYIEATIVFSSIKDYDKLIKSITPKESIKLLSKFMSIAEEVTKKYNGSIDKIIGETIMLVFRKNSLLPSHALRAAQASLELVKRANEIGLPKLNTGIDSGIVISGKIGSYSGKLDYTVIGNPVNSAYRFKTESQNGTEQTGIIISGIAIWLTKGKVKVKFLRRVSIKGKSRMYNIYELVGIRE